MSIALVSFTDVWHPRLSSLLRFRVRDGEPSSSGGVTGSIFIISGVGGGGEDQEEAQT